MIYPVNLQFHQFVDSYPDDYDLPICNKIFCSGFHCDLSSSELENVLENVLENLFSELSNLCSIHLSGNSLSSVPGNLFSRLTNL